MDAHEVRRIRDSKEFQELERRRGSYSWTLTVVMLAIYFGFILLVAFGGGFVATQISGPITIAFPLGLAVIFSAVILTGVYVLRANTEFDALTRQIVDGVPPARPVGAVHGSAVGASR